MWLKSDWLTSMVKTYDPRAALDAAIRNKMYTQPRAKAFSLSAYADAEGSGEGAVFERALKRALDPDVARMIRRHQQDENQHARWLTERRVALGLPEETIPAHLKTIERLSEESGGTLDLPMTEDEHVAEVYALLYVVEERALEEFDHAARGLEAVGDTESAALFRTIAKDEERHLRYCTAIGNRYGGGEAAFTGRVARMRAIEARVYAAQQRAFTQYLLDTGRLVLPWWIRAVTTPMMAVANALHLSGPAARPPVWA